MPEMTEPLAATFGALLLAGGQSRRMGQDKAQLQYKGGTLLEHMRVLAQSSGADPVLIGGGPHGDLPDRLSGAGPAASLCALARYAAHPDHRQRWIILPVDMPLLTVDLLRHLAGVLARAANFWGQPLPMMIHFDAEARDIMEKIEEKMREGESISLQRVLKDLRATELTPRKDDVRRLVNANTPEEWQQLSAQSINERGV